MLNENAKMFIVQQVVHWLSTPTHGYLGSNYGIDLYAELQKPLSEFNADGIINKMYADIPILANLPRDFINIHYQHNGIDDVKIFISVGSGADSVSIDLNFLADKLENSIIDKKMAFMQPKTEDAPDFFHGMIDDISMYNRYLSDEEIKPPPKVIEIPDILKDVFNLNLDSEYYGFVEFTLSVQLHRYGSIIQTIAIGIHGLRVGDPNTGSMSNVELLPSAITRLKEQTGIDVAELKAKDAKNGYSSSSYAYVSSRVQSETEKQMLAAFETYKEQIK